MKNMMEKQHGYTYVLHDLSQCSLMAYSIISCTDDFQIHPNSAYFAPMTSCHLPKTSLVGKDHDSQANLLTIPRFEVKPTVAPTGKEVPVLPFELSSKDSPG